MNAQRTRSNAHTTLPVAAGGKRSRRNVPAKASHLPLAPGTLSASASDAVQQISAAATARNTARSYNSALRYWAGWYCGRYGQMLVLPVEVPVVLQFIVDHLARRPDPDKPALRWELPPDLDRQLVAEGLKKRPGCLSLATVMHRVAVLSEAHRNQQAVRDLNAGGADALPNPCASEAVRQLMADARRASHRRGVAPHKKSAISRAELNAMLATCEDDLIGLRDRALLYFAFSSGGRRRSEVTGATLEKLRRIEGGYLYTLDSGKTIKTAEDAEKEPPKPIMGRAGEALEAWIKASGITQGPIFRNLRSKRVGNALSDYALAKIVMRRAAMAGLIGDFGGHSLRSGFVTECGKQGIPLPEVMKMTGHRSVTSVIGYYQAGTGLQNSDAAYLADNDAPAHPRARSAVSDT